MAGRNQPSHNPSQSVSTILPGMVTFQAGIQGRGRTTISSSRGATELVLLVFLTATLLKPARSAAAETVLYTNARIYTNDSAMPWAEALAVRDEKLLAVGSTKEVRAIAGKTLSWSISATDL